MFGVFSIKMLKNAFFGVFPRKMHFLGFFSMGRRSGVGHSQPRFFDPDLFAVRDRIDRRRLILPHLFVRDIQCIP